MQPRSKLPEELSTGPLKQDECGPAVGMPKVALLYLTRGPMAHEQLWSTWFEQAAGQSELQNRTVAATSRGSARQLLLDACLQELCGINGAAI